MKYCYAYPRPAVTADIVLFKKSDDRYWVLLVKRKNAPFEGMWALPGGFMNMDETLEDAALRELSEETGIKGVQLEQYHTFSNINRDPRHRTVTTVFIGFADPKTPQPVAGDDAAQVYWFPMDELPPLAFDHELVMELLKKKVVF